MDTASRVFIPLRFYVVGYVNKKGQGRWNKVMAENEHHPFLVSPEDFLLSRFEKHRIKVLLATTWAHPCRAEITTFLPH